MSVEKSPIPNGGFYRALTTVEEATRKIQGFLNQPPATLSDEQLFEAIADTHATSADRLVGARMMAADGGFLTSDDIISIDFKRGEEIEGIGYWEKDDKQIVYIDLYLGYTFFFCRSRDGSIEITRSSDDVDDNDDEHFSSPDAYERELILGELMICLKQPIENISC